MAKLIFHPHHRFEWGTVFAGTVVACAISIVLLQFGAAVGLADDTLVQAEGNALTWGVIAIGIWLLWVQLLSSLAGGYVAGYLHSVTPEAAAHESEMRDGMYGLSVWATSTVLTFVVMALAAWGAAEVAADSEAIDPLSGVVSDTEQNTAIIFAFLMGATSLMSAVAAWWAATMGGMHRATGVDFSDKLSFRK